MATSTNYGWAEPDNSSLVKNGAADIRTLGDAIDTSVWNVGFGQAGKNKIINGDFKVNQRNFTTNTTDAVFLYDRFGCRIGGDGTATFSAQTFTPGAAPVSGYEGSNYLRIVTTGQTTSAVRTLIRQTLEDVRSFAGQTVTLSFWAKAATGTPKIAAFMYQNFGSGGSASVDIPISAPTISTSWARYSVTVSIPSITGKTIGTGSGVGIDLCVSAGSTYNTQYSSIGIQSNTFEIWGIQAEYGSKATPFQLAGGGQPQAELALCQRYYFRTTSPTAAATLGQGACYTTTTMLTTVIHPVPLRVAATSVEYANIQGSDVVNNYATFTNFTINQGCTQNTTLYGIGFTGLTQYRVAEVRTSTTGGYIGLSAEL